MSFPSAEREHTCACQPVHTDNSVLLCCIFTWPALIREVSGCSAYLCAPEPHMVVDWLSGFHACLVHLPLLRLHDSWREQFRLGMLRLQRARSALL